MLSLYLLQITSIHYIYITIFLKFIKNVDHGLILLSYLLVIVFIYG